MKTKANLPAAPRVAPRTIHSSQNARRSGFTLIELLTVIAIIGILAAILIPVVGLVRETAKIAQASSNVREIGTLMHIYLEENDEYLPTDVGGLSLYPFWLEALWQTAHPEREFPEFTSATHGDVFSDTVFYTPLLESVAANGGQPRSFGWNLELRRNTGSGDRARFSAFADPSQTICLADTTTSSTIHPGNGQVNYRNKGKALFLFLDGHVSLLQPSEVPAKRTHVFWGGTETDTNETPRR